MNERRSASDRKDGDRKDSDRKDGDRKDSDRKASDQDDGDRSDRSESRARDGRTSEHRTSERRTSERQISRRDMPERSPTPCDAAARTTMLRSAGPRADFGRPGGPVGLGVARIFVGALLLAWGTGLYGGSWSKPAGRDGERVAAPVRATSSRTPPLRTDSLRNAPLRTAAAAECGEAAYGGEAQFGEAPAAGRLSLHLSAPMRGRWRVVDDAAAPRDLRLDVRLGPRGVPKHRFPRGTVLQAERGTTWVEFIGGPLDDVLRLRIDCRVERSRSAERAADGEAASGTTASELVLDVVVTPWVQPTATGAAVRYTEFAERRWDQLADAAAQRAELQLRWLGAVPGKDGRSAPRGSGAMTPAGLRARMLADYEYQAARETQKRLAHLDRLRDQLDGIAELEVRVVRSGDGRPVRLAELGSTTARALDLSATYGGTTPPPPKGRARP